MSERRSARRAATPGARARGTSQTLPAELSNGPCIEDWAGEDRNGSAPWMRARWNWAKAVDLWAIESGWATERRPASNARNLARTRHPWSREFLLARGEADYVAWLDGLRDTNPGRSEVQWTPRH
jgi:hypothetical protein